MRLPEAAAAFREMMGGYTGWWGAAGGWAIDLFLTRATREHEDLEVVALRSDFATLFRQLEAHKPVLIFPGASVRFEPWKGDPFPESVIQLRQQFRGTDFDVLLTPSEDGKWICRRDESVRLPLGSVLRETASGIPVLAPEIVLLFKAKRVEDKDESDFTEVLPQLDPTARRWLATRLASLYPGHAWIQRLR